MRERLIIFSILFLFLSAGVVTAMSISDMREWLMKTNGFAMLDLKKIADGNAPFDKARIESAFKTIRQASVDIPNAFPKGSNAVTQTSSPAIWENWADFSKKAEKLVADTDAAMAHLPDNKGQLVTVLQTLSADCSDCHTSYRLKEYNAGMEGRDLATLCPWIGNIQYRFSPEWCISLKISHISCVL
jgi:cytochrome c556